MQRDSIVIYRSMYEAINKLPSEERGAAYEVILRYGFDGVEPAEEGIIGVIFSLIKPQLDANAKRYENGKKGGAPVGNRNARNNRKTTKNNRATTTETTENNQKQANVYVNVHDNVHVNDDDNARACCDSVDDEKESIVDVLKGIVFDCEFCYTLDDYKRAQHALDESAWAKTNITHLSKLHRLWDKLLNGFYKDFVKPEKAKADGQNMILQEKSFDELNAIYDELNAQLI